MNCVIFDLDGTLLYTLEGLFKSTNFALAKFGYQKRTIKEIEGFVGNGVQKLIERASEEKDPKITKGILEVFKEHYSKTMQENTKPYDGIIELLKKLNENAIICAVNSNKYHSATSELCEKYFKNLIMYAQGETPDCPKKPDPTGVKLIMKKLNAKNVLYVGDSLVDIQTAKNAGIECISVCWGYCDKKILQEYNKNIVQNPAELFEKILNYFKLS